MENEEIKTEKLGGLTLYLSNYYYLKSKKDQNTSTYQ